MEKLYKLIVLFVGLTVLNLTAQAQQNRRAPYLFLSAYSNFSSFYGWDDILNHSKPQQTLDFINYPNPASASTTVSYYLANKANIQLRVIDLAGKQLAVLIKQQQNAGKHEYYWEFARNNISAGMYILFLQVDNKSYSRKIIVQ
ncbi:T9SS type A sorting domain-containing protein [Pedobacter cryotolerans]|uniref:T9SS type A sorting domain-containing protein n=1 Tax=Pedobacter cryotolerans TaxID=2571270 RepID=A0A4U1BWJ2_9SPHI|nr:T9SS type A sorting domain-containing protein [Pedobacter cryotolerans]TKB97305.1 T9SS type A sorting domain-containing protein [Pedobacter cryotolerans]